jgi:hypothetical protein
MIDTSKLENLALSESGFLFEVSTGHTFTLNETGTFLLRKLIAGDDPSTLVDALLEEYEVTQSDAQQDLERFLERLVGLGIGR